MKINPFKYGCVVGKDYFCPREKLERQLQGFAESGQNVVLYGARRMGKSSLVRQALGKMSARRVVYIDLFFIATKADFCRRVLEGVAKANESLPFLKKAMALVTRLRPTLSFDGNDGTPVISVDARAAEETDSLNAVLEMLAKIAADGKTTIVFDEFQDILRLPDALQILAEMRAKIQLQAETPYFFLGSVRHSMLEIFASSGSPFFKSAAAVEVGEIPAEDFAAFIVKRFAAGDRTIDTETAQQALAVADGVSGDVQEMCAALWETTEPASVITVADIPAALEQIFARESKNFARAVGDLTATQLAVLKGLANHPGAKIYAGEFLEATRIASTGTVKKSVARLETLELLYADGATWHFTDPFLREWVRRKL